LFYGTQQIDNNQQPHWFLYFICSLFFFFLSLLFTCSLSENRRLIHQAAFFRLAAKKLRLHRSFQSVDKVNLSF